MNGGISWRVDQEKLLQTIDHAAQHYKEADEKLRQAFFHGLMKCGSQALVRIQEAVVTNKNCCERTERRLLQLFDTLEQKSIDLHTFFELVGGNTPAAQQPVLTAIEHLLARGWLEERGGDFYPRTEAGGSAIREKSSQD